MIPIIGLIVGIYACIRLLGMTTGDRFPSWIRVLSVLATCAIIFLMVALLDIHTPSSP